MSNRKAIYFDLYTNELLKFFDDTSTPYKQIKQFMLENGFEHEQYSGYHSKEPMSYIQITSFLDRLAYKFEWLGDCIRKFDVTEIGEKYSFQEYSLSYLILSIINYKTIKYP